MNEDTNVVDFNGRAAHQRNMRMAYSLSELAGDVVKAVFDAAFIAARVDADGDCIVDDDMTIVVSPDAGKDLIKVFALFGSSGNREQTLQFCNRFNQRLVAVRAQVRDSPSPDGQWTVVFDYDRLVFEGEKIEARTIVHTVRRFEAIVRSGIGRYDEDNIL